MQPSEIIYLQVEYWQSQLKPLLRYTNDGPVVPKYYYVPKDKIEEEKARPGSQQRLPSNDGTDGNIFLWGQSILLISQLLGKHFKCIYFFVFKKAILHNMILKIISLQI